MKYSPAMTISDSFRADFTSIYKHHKYLIFPNLNFQNLNLGCNIIEKKLLRAEHKTFIDKVATKMR